MQAVKGYNPTHGMEYLFRRLAENARTKKREVVVSQKNVGEYVEELLTLEEQKLCDMATD